MGEIFWGDFLGGFFGEDFFGGNFFGRTFGRSSTKSYLNMEGIDFFVKIGLNQGRKEDKLDGSSSHLKMDELNMTSVNYKIGIVHRCGIHSQK